MIDSISSVYLYQIKILVSSSLSHMMKVWENLKLEKQKCNVALPSEDIVDPSAVCKVLLQAIFLSCTGLQSYHRH